MRPTDAAHPDPGRPGSGRRDLAWMLGLAAVLLSFFLIPFLAGGSRFPVGPDGPVYLWWMRLAGHEWVIAASQQTLPAGDIEQMIFRHVEELLKRKAILK